MLPYFVLDQINIGPIKLYTWGLFVGLGFSAGYLLFYYLARRENLSPGKIIGLALAIFIGGILGAKGLAQIAAGSGAMFMGGLLGAILVGGIFVKISGLDFWRTADLLALPTLLGIGLGRIGCFLINDHQGAITGLPWGILWPDGVLRHPVAIYEFLAAFGLLAALWIFRKKINSSGQLFLIFLASYSFIRFFLDFARASTGLLADPRWGALSMSQWLAGVVFLISLVLLIYKRKC